MEFENRSGDPALDPLGRIVAAWITDGLVETQLVDVVPTDITIFSPEIAAAAKEAMNPPSLITHLANGTGAGIVVSGSFFLEGESLRFQAQIIDAREMSVLESVRATSALEEEMEGVEALRQRVMGALATHLDSRLKDWVATSRHVPRFDAYALNMEAAEAYFRSDFERNAALNLRAYALDSAFFRPLFIAASAHKEERALWKTLRDPFPFGWPRAGPCFLS
jgi:TolB-like protein